MRTSVRRVLVILCLVVIVYCWLGIIWHVGRRYAQYLSQAQVSSTTATSRLVTLVDSMAPHDTVDQSAVLFNSAAVATDLEAPPTLHHCNLPQSFRINEGQPMGELVLRHVHIFLRHGIRTPLGSGVTELGVKEAECSMTSLSQKSPYVLKFLQVLKNVTSFAVNSLTWKELIDRFGTHPNSDRCGKSQLTSAGANQLLELGRRMRSAFDKNDKFRKEYEPHIHRQLALHVTMYSRTVQSAIAFLYGFLEADFSAAGLDALQVYAMNNIYFCGPSVEDTPCHCPLVHRKQEGGASRVVPEAHVTLTQQVYANLTLHLHTYGIRRIPHVREVIDAMMPILCQGQGQENVDCPPVHPDSAAAADVLDTKDAMKMQGQGHTCFPRQLLDGMWRVLDNDKAREASNEAERHRQRLLAFPLLREVSQRLLDIQLRRRFVPSFSFYHGHDQTITSLLIALGIGDSRWPPFASRLTIETYAASSPKSESSDAINAGRHGNGLLLRFLYNGEDVTSSLPWCRHVTVEGSSRSRAVVLCSLDSLLAYLSNHASGYFHTGHYLTDCDLDHNQ